MCVCVCVFVREIQRFICVCVCEREIQRFMCVCVCVCERDTEVYVCVCVREIQRFMCVCVCVVSVKVKKPLLGERMNARSLREKKKKTARQQKHITACFFTGWQTADD